MSSEEVAGTGAPSKDAVLAALRGVIDPELRKDVVALNQILASVRIDLLVEACYFWSVYVSAHNVMS